MRPRGVRDLRHQAVYLFGVQIPTKPAGDSDLKPATIPT